MVTDPAQASSRKLLTHGLRPAGEHISTALADVAQVLISACSAGIRTVFRFALDTR